MRKGGVSGDQYGEFNIDPHYGDTPDAVMMNRKALYAELQIDDTHLLMAHQVHGTEAQIITEEFFSLSPSTRRRLSEGVDTLITVIPHVCIGVSTADCILMLLHDEEYHTAAAMRAGWRGTVARIVQKTIVTIQQFYYTQPAHLHAYIRPDISLRHSEIGGGVYQALARTGFNMPAISQYMGKWYINLPGCNRLQLLEVDVNDDRIPSTDICTYEQVDACFSVRRLGIQSGRVYNGITLL